MLDKIYDVLIIGGGPAGLSAGIYTGRGKLDTLIVEKENKGSQIKLTEEVVNYPGILETTGSDLIDTMRIQAKNFGVEFLQDEVMDVDFKSKIKTVKTAKKEYKALSIIIATGASPKKLNFPGEEKYTGKGIGYCAVCDGEFFTGMDIFVVGAGYAAAEEAIFLTKFGRKVYIIAREPEFTCAKSIADKVLANPKIEVKFNTEIVEANGDTYLREIRLKNNTTNKETLYTARENETFGVFIFVGYEPQSKMFKGHININEEGYIIAGEETLTNVEGIYAVGDVRVKKLKQVVTAVADGATAATEIEGYIQGMREKLNLNIKTEETKMGERLIKEESCEKSLEIEKEIPVEIKKEYQGTFAKEQVEEIQKELAPIENIIEIGVIKGSKQEKNQEFINFLEEVKEISSKINIKLYNEEEIKEKNIGRKKLPTIVLFDKDSNYSRVSYSALPLGHEFKSFVLALRNLGSNKQEVRESYLERINKLDKKINIKIGVSPKCKRCPDTVQASQRIAVENKNIEVEVIDVFEHTDFKTKYGLLSVPAIVINDDVLRFGQMDLEEMIEILESI